MSKTTACSFCQRDQSTIAKLVAGPCVFICESCVVHALSRAILSANRTRDNTEASETSAVRYCSFCGKPRDEVLCMAVHDTNSICNECLSLCLDIILEEHPKRVVDMPPWNGPTSGSVP